MPDRTIILGELKTPDDLFRLKEYIRELYALLDKRYVSVTYAASVTFNADEGEVFEVELTGNITGITLSNAYQGREITLIFKQDATGSRTVAGWAANVKLTGAAFTVTSTASSHSVLTLVYDGTNWVEKCRALDVR